MVNVKRGCLQELAPGLKIDEQQLIKSLTEDSQYKFLGKLEVGDLSRSKRSTSSLRSRRQ